MNTVQPETQGFSSQRLARIGAVMDAYVAAEKLAGIVSLVARRGRVVHFQSNVLGSVGSYGWGGAANTNFWIDPQEELIGILMLQYMPSDTLSCRE